MKTILVATQDAGVASRAIEAGFHGLILGKPIDGLARVPLWIRKGDQLLADNTVVGTWNRVASKTDEQAAAAQAGKHDILVVEADDWKVIPLENLIAAIAGRSRLFAVARTPQEAELFLGTLEKGVDGIVVPAADASGLAGFDALLKAQGERRLRLEPATVTRIEPVGMGERVCVDTCSILSEGEGMLIGSSSRAFFLVAAETLETEYVRARPFRVNAGAVHSYLLVGEKTHYLSELAGGQRLEAVASDGRARTVVAGRLKMETRPLLQVEAEIDGERHRVILQNAETIRLARANADPVPVTRLAVGDEILIHRQSAARHFGMPVEERLEER